MKKNILIINVILLMLPICLASNNIGLEFGYSVYPGSGLIKVVFPSNSDKPNWLKSSKLESIIPDLLITQVPLNKKFTIQFEIGMVHPIWMLRNHSGIRIGFKRDLISPVVSHVALGYSQFLRVKGGSTLDVRLKGYSYPIVRKWFNIEPELHAGIRVGERNNSGTLQVFDYIRSPVNILFRDIPIGISIGTLMAFTFGSNGKTGIGLVPDFYISINFGSFTHRD